MAGVSVKGLSSTMLKLSRVGQKTSKKALRVFRKGAQEMGEEAKLMAPRKHGDIENAIEVTETIGTGVRGRNEIKVWVNPRKLGPGYTKYGFRYDILVHENATLNLGPVSQEKQASDSRGRIVGPKYMERAKNEIAPKINREIKAIAKEVKL